MFIKYTTGEVASFFKVKKDTLYHYDKIGLIKPEIVGENGYRYYSFYQLTSFEIIKILKESGMSLKEIKNYLDNKNPQDLIALLKGNIQRLEKKKAEIENTQNFLKRTVQELNVINDISIGEVEFVYCPVEYLIATKSNFATKFDEKIMFESFKDHHEYCESNNFGEGLHVGEIILKQDIDKGEFKESYYYSRIPKKVKSNRLFIKPEGMYATLYYQGNYDDLPKAYENLCNKITDMGKIIKGNIYEEDVVDCFSQENPNKYVLKISVEIEG